MDILAAISARRETVAGVAAVFTAGVTVAVIAVVAVVAVVVDDPCFPLLFCGGTRLAAFAKAAPLGLPLTGFTTMGAILLL